MRYMLDTDICIYIIKCRPESVARRFRELANEREFRRVQGLMVENWASGQ